MLGVFITWAKTPPLGVVSGRVNFQGLSSISDQTKPIIDQNVEKNFGRTDNVSQNIDAPQQLGVARVPPAGWSLHVNDAFYLGAVHGGRDIFLASPRTNENINRVNSEGQQRRYPIVMAREIAIVLGSGAYELHKTEKMGEVLKFVGASPNIQYGFPEALEAVRRYTDLPHYRASLTQFSDINLDTGEVAVMKFAMLSNQSSGSIVVNFTSFGLRIARKS